MVFSSLTFLVFFLPSVLVLYYLTRNIVWRNTILLCMSILFYAWGEPRNVLIMLISIIVNFYAGKVLTDRNILSSPGKRRGILILDVIFNLSFLFYFKYLGFSAAIVNSGLNFLGFDPVLITSVVLPIGISFYTFQAMSYVIDVYRNPALVQPSILNLGLYITLFPQLIAGPIVRYHDISDQISYRKHELSSFTAGLRRFIIGLSKKVLIANIVGETADTIFGMRFSSVSTLWIWIAVMAYALQIFYDFSGYSDMAIGLGKMFGFTFLENFNYPYMSKSITEFWRRWHISLSSWFRDYLYIPLGGNRLGKKRTIINTFIVFFVTGLWHGAAFNFIVWGLGHGIIMTIEKSVTKRIQRRPSVLLDVLLHFYTLFSVLVLWVFFRMDMADAVKNVLKMFGINYSQFAGTYRPIEHIPLAPLLLDPLFLTAFSAGIVFAFPWWRKSPVLLKIRTNPLFNERVASLGCLLLFALCFVFIASSTYNPFIYFRF